MDLTSSITVSEVVFSVFGCKWCSEKLGRVVGVLWVYLNNNDFINKYQLINKVVIMLVMKHRALGFDL